MESLLNKRRLLIFFYFKAILFVAVRQQVAEVVVEAVAAVLAIAQITVIIVALGHVHVTAHRDVTCRQQNVCGLIGVTAKCAQTRGLVNALNVPLFNNLLMCSYYLGYDPYLVQAWNDHYQSLHSAYSHASHAPSARDSVASVGGASDTQTQPAMLTLKQFLDTQDENISDSEVMRKYTEYKTDFKRQQLNEFFVAHKDEEW